MFDVIHPRSLNQLKDRVVIASNVFDPIEGNSLKLAREAREVSGDLVVFHGTSEIVRNDEWLWDWEKNNPESYAWQAISKIVHHQWR